MKMIILQLCMKKFNAILYAFILMDGKLKTKLVLPSTVHFEDSFINDKSRESFDKLVDYNTDYKKVFIIKGVKNDILIHANGQKKN